MELSKRQHQILERIVAEYVKAGTPVSSQYLEEVCGIGVSPATIRNDMKVLTEEGLIAQPHISSGRVPTDKGYRIVVNELLEREEQRRAKPQAHSLEPKEEQDFYHLAKDIATELAAKSSMLAAVYAADADLFWKEGWEMLLRTPEFSEEGTAVRFTRFIRDVEDNIGDIALTGQITIYIGQENRFSKVKDFSIIVAECVFPEQGKGMIALAGPKRMPYYHNINLLKSVIDILSDQSV